MYDLQQSLTTLLLTDRRMVLTVFNIVVLLT